jgi:hypothetical protein
MREHPSMLAVERQAPAYVGRSSFSVQIGNCWKQGEQKSLKRTRNAWSTGSPDPFELRRAIHGVTKSHLFPGREYPGQLSYGFFVELKVDDIVRNVIDLVQWDEDVPLPPEVPFAKDEMC